MMKATLFALATLIFFAFGTISMVVGFSGTPTERLLDRVSPVVLIVTLAGFVAYIVDSLRNPRVPEPKRKLWAIVLFLGHFFAQPFYWWSYVRPKRT
jgi:hypothetical protein